MLDGHVLPDGGGSRRVFEVPRRTAGWKPMLKRELRSCLSIVAIVLMTRGMAQAAEAPAAPAIWTQPEIEKGYVVFQHNTLEAMPTGYVPARKAITSEAPCSMAQGEYKSLQFAVHALADGLESICVTVECDLPVTVYHRREEFIDPSAAKGASAEDWMYLRRGDAVGRVPARATVNFWLTFRADTEALPGAHRGKIRIDVGGRPPTELALAVNVRPFQLASARIPFGMYCVESFLAVYRDMAAHSQNSVSFYYAGDFSTLPPKRGGKNSQMVEAGLPLALEAGLVHPDIPCLSLAHNFADLVTAKEMEKVKAGVAWLETERRSRGWPELILYGTDEPPVPSPGLREAYAPLRALPIRVGTAMGIEAVSAFGDLHDVWIVYDGYVTPEMQAEAKRCGAEVWSYTFRMWRQSYDPFLPRFYAGLYTWAVKLRGNYVWSYYYGYNWKVPVSGETMPTTGWEARREGVDDYRYLQMVEDAVKANPDDPGAVEAAVWLETLRARVISNPHPHPFSREHTHPGLLGFPSAVGRVDPITAEAGKPLGIEEFEAIRATAADYIEKLGPVSAERAEPRAITYLKDEAAAFRGKSVAQCIAALADSDASKRRAAATALFELGPKAAPAVSALARVLDDPKVRFPALRALGAIGADAHPAAPKVALLLSHPDDFVRQAATLTLKGFATVHKELLVETPEFWSFRKDRGKEGESEKWFLPAMKKESPQWSTISTHKFWEKGYVGDGWYALDIVIPKTDGKRVWLHFGSVDENYTLWINGQYVDDNMDAGTALWNVPVEAEITGKFTEGESNHIVVRVSNTAQAGGIWKPVTLLRKK